MLTSTSLCATRFDALQQCMTTCPLAGPSMHHAGMLRLLQDICTASGELPSKYWLRGISVNWREYVARGGEATIFRGTMGGRNVVVREVSKPGEHDWTSPEGERVIKVLQLLSRGQLGIELFTQVYQARDYRALPASTSQYHSTVGDIS